MELLARYGVEPIDPGEVVPGAQADSDVLRVHSQIYVDAVREIGHQEAERRLNQTTAGLRPLSDDELGFRFTYGIGGGDVPAFPNMHEISLDYVKSVATAARAVRDGAPLAFGIGGGLHHAHRSKAHGFCIYDDPAIALHILRERFSRVAYVDIDVHQGDGVQWIFYDDPTVLTCSIHEEGRTLYPGTGWVDEVGAEFSALNVPVKSGTTGDVWLWIFEQTILPALERFQPEAIVLQMGADPHFADPLAQVNCRQQDWLEAVKRIRDLKLPTVAVGGGGYNINNVPRMWTSAILEFAHIRYDDRLPEDLAQRWSVPTFNDHNFHDKNGGRAHAEEILNWLQTNHRLLQK